MHATSEADVRTVGTSASIETAHGESATGNHHIHNSETFLISIELWPCALEQNGFTSQNTLRLSDDGYRDVPGTNIDDKVLVSFVILSKRLIMLSSVVDARIVLVRFLATSEDVRLM